MRHLPVYPPGWQWVRVPLVAISQPGIYIVERFMLGSSWELSNLALYATDWTVYFLLSRGILWIVPQRQSEPRP
jgi:hypothetical protein